MKKHLLLTLVGGILLLLCVQACNDQEAPHNQAPTLTIGTATVSGRTTATIKGSIVIPTGSEVAECGFIYSTVSTLPEEESTVVPINPQQVNGDCSIQLTGLQPNTHYYYCLYASSGYTTLRSSVGEFTTDADGVPAFAEVVCSNVTSSSVTLQSELIDDGGYEIITMGFCYKMLEEGEDEDPVQEDNAINVSTESATFGVTLEDLQPDKRYSVRAYGTNQEGVGYGPTITFTTQASEVPVLSSTEAIEEEALSVRVEASLIDQGTSEVTEMGFCWSAESEEPTIEMSHQSGSEMSEAGTFSLLIENLLPGTTYYIRAYAMNGNGTGYGPVLAYTTGKSSVAVVETLPADEVEETSALLSGRIVSDGGSTILSRGFYYSTEEENVMSGRRCYSEDEGDAITYALTELDVATTYYYCAYAENENGISTGEILSFTTEGQRTVPTVQTAEASNLTETSARLNGTISSDGHSAIISKGFYWGTDVNPAQNGTQVVSASEGNAFTYDLGSLTAGTTYYYCAYAENGEGIGYGEAISFSTQEATTTPTVSGTTVSDITETSASLAAEITSDGGMEVTEKGFCYSSTNTAPSTSDSKVVSTASGNAITGTLSNLSGSTTYYVRAYAINEKGTSYGAMQQFTTSLALSVPAVSNTSVNNITTTTASLSASVTSDGGAEVTEKGFYYGTNNPPTEADTKVVSAAAGTDITGELSGLTPNTRYYVRAFATNSQGTVMGSVQVFTTADDRTAPSIGSVTYSGITESSITLLATIIDNGGGEITEKGFCYTTDANTVPTVEHNKAVSTTEGDDISLTLTGLNASTTYYIRAYATNGAQTGYSDMVTVTTNASSTPGVDDNPSPDKD